MAQKFAGIAFLMVDGAQVRLRGNFTVSPSPVERTMIAGQDGVHGYQELPRVPYIEGDLSMTPDTSLEDLVAQTDYGGPVTAIVGHDTAVGTQFHPEKSQRLGLALIANFLKWKP